MALDIADLNETIVEGVSTQAFSAGHGRQLAVSKKRRRYLAFSD
jgi:hypothetical protein